MVVLRIALVWSAWGPAASAADPLRAEGYEGRAPSSEAAPVTAAGAIELVTAWPTEEQAIDQLRLLWLARERRNWRDAGQQHHVAPLDVGIPAVPHRTTNHAGNLCLGSGLPFRVNHAFQKSALKARFSDFHGSKWVAESGCTAPATWTPPADANR
jgi:hypothetical protein